jgi:hypothetical protein
MKTLIIITSISFAIFAVLLVVAILDGRKEPSQGTVITYPDEEMFMENDLDEFSAENMISDETIKIVRLRNKLEQIEKERDYERKTEK